MSGAWFFGFAAMLNVASVIALVLAVRERRRIENERRRVRRENAAAFMEPPTRLGFSREPAGRLRW